MLGWFEGIHDDKPAFDFRSYVIARDTCWDSEHETSYVKDNPGHTFSAESSPRRSIKHFAEKNEPTAFMFVPLDLIPQRNDWNPRFGGIQNQKVVASLGANGLVPPDIKHVVMFDTAKLGKMDIRRKVLAYHPKNIVLVDFDSEEEGLYPAVDFAFDNKGSMLFMGESSIRKRRVFEAAGQAIAAMAAQCELANEITHVHWNFQSSMRSYGINGENVRKHTESFKHHLEHAQFAFNVLSFGRSDSLLSECLDTDNIHRMIARNLLDDPFGHVCAQDWSLDNWHRVEDIKDFGVEIFGISVDEGKWHIQELREAARIVGDLRQIWDKCLDDYNSILELPSSIRMSSNEKERELAVESLHALGRVYGVDSAIDSYFAGVPLEDILA